MLEAATTLNQDKNNIAFELRNITKLFAGTVALENVELSVRRGEVHGIIGKNGAGKSTLVNIISGIIPPSKGEIIINGNSYPSFSPRTAKKQNISIITQEPQVINESTLTENLFMPVYKDGRQLIPWHELDKKAQDILNKAGFPIDVTLKIRDLSISEKQILLVIKSCYVENADIIIMDEVSASLTQKDANILYGIIKERIAAGKTVIFISHHTEELLRVCDRVTVIRDGHSVGCFECADLNMNRLASLIVGNTDYNALKMADKSEMISEQVLFEIKDFTNYGKFEDINICIHKGEIVGLAGLRGSGRTELFKSIVGIDSFDKGKLFINNSEKKYKSPAKASEDGVLYLPEEREAEGLIGISTIKKNLTINVFPRISKHGFIFNKLENPLAEGLIKELDIKAYSRDQLINQLSGGNKQKVVVGKVMAHSPIVCLLDEPTRGVDIEAKESILHSINEKLREDSCVLISSPGVDDLIKICDRILVLYKGRIIDMFCRDDFDEKDIFRAMQGEIIHDSEVTS